MSTGLSMYIGFVVGMLLTSAIFVFIGNESRDLKAECQKDLPRSQICIMQYVPEE